MRWKNLVENKCPECGKMLSEFKDNYATCKCGFGISMTKFKKIVNNILDKKEREKPQISNEDALNQM